MNERIVAVHILGGGKVLIQCEYNLYELVGHSLIKIKIGIGEFGPAN